MKNERKIKSAFVSHSNIPKTHNSLIDIGRVGFISFLLLILQAWYENENLRQWLCCLDTVRGALDYSVAYVCDMVNGAWNARSPKSVEAEKGLTTAELSEMGYESNQIKNKKRQREEKYKYKKKHPLHSCAIKISAPESE